MKLKGRIYYQAQGTSHCIVGSNCRGNDLQGGGLALLTSGYLNQEDAFHECS
jgi:hypothetical protein